MTAVRNEAGVLQGIENLIQAMRQDRSDDIELKGALSSLITSMKTGSIDDMIEECGLIRARSIESYNLFAKRLPGIAAAMGPFNPADCLNNVVGGKGHTKTVIY